MVVTNVFFPEVEKDQNTMSVKRQFTVSQAYGPMLQVRPCSG